ncbi:MAG: LysM peptidoglycan-binding domain-containing protein [Candidatus Omnitrophota bacterium]
MDRFKLAAILGLVSTLALSGCVARTYNLTRDRVDQDLSNSTGNRGYIMGKAPEPVERKTTRTTRVFEVELGLAKKSTTACPSTTPIVPMMEESLPMAQETIEPAMESFEKYTVAKNDTLQKISKKFYGTTKRWMKIYDANKDVLRGPDKLYPGQTLNIPTDSSMKAEVAEETKENLK